MNRQKESETKCTPLPAAEHKPRIEFVPHFEAQQASHVPSHAILHVRIVNVRAKAKIRTTKGIKSRNPFLQ